MNLIQMISPEGVRIYTSPDRIEELSALLGYRVISDEPPVDLTPVKIRRPRPPRKNDA